MQLQKAKIKLCNLFILKNNVLIEKEFTQMRLL